MVKETPAHLLAVPGCLSHDGPLQGNGDPSPLQQMPRDLGLMPESKQEQEPDLPAIVHAAETPESCAAIQQTLHRLES